MILPIKYQAQVLTLLHDGQGHNTLECTLALCQERFYWNTMFQDVINYVKTCPQCQMAKGDNIDPKAKPGKIIANNPMDLLCIDFTMVDPSKSSKENIFCYVQQCYRCVNLKGCLGVRCCKCKYIGALQYTMLIFGFSFLWVLAGIKKETMQLYLIAITLFITTLLSLIIQYHKYTYKYTLICIASCCSSS